MNIIIKNFKLMTLVSMSLIFFGAKCKKDSSKPCNNSAYSFTITSQLGNEKSVYNINDTIIINSVIPKAIVDKQSNNSIDYSNNLGIGGSFSFIKIDSINHSIDKAIDSFAIITEKGITSINSTKYLLVTYDKTSSNFLIRIKIIPKKIGSYYFGVNDLYCQGIIGKDCTNANFSNKIVANDKNLSILSNAQVSGVILDPYLTDRIFCFRVQ